MKFIFFDQKYQNSLNIYASKCFISFISCSTYYSMCKIIKNDKCFFKWKSVRIRLTLPKWGFGSPLGLLKFQSSIVGVKTPCIETFFISLENYQSVDVENGLAWAIWTSVAQVMAKRKLGSEIGNSIPDHKKSKIDPISVCASGMRYAVRKLLMRAKTLL